MEQQDESAEARFQATALIGTRFRTIARDGTVTIADGLVSLRKRKGDVIAEAPIGEVWADKNRLGAATIWIDDRKLSIGAPFGSTAAADDLAGGAYNVAKGVNLIKAGKGLADAFLAVLEAEGGNIGKPPEA